MQTNVLEYFEDTVCRFPEKTAVADSSGETTFGDLHSQAHHLARAIQAKGGCWRQPVGLFLPKRRETVAALLGVLYGGGCYCPLDVKWPTERLRQVLDNLGPPMVVSDTQRLDALCQAGWPEDRAVLTDQILQSLPHRCQDEKVVSWQNSVDTDPVYVIYTSGSTGIPKGVVISHRSVLDYIDWAKDCYRISSSERIGNQAPLQFDNSTLDLYLSFSTGATLFLIPEDLFLFPIRLIEYLRKMEINFIFWVPSLLGGIAHYEILDKTALPPLQKILFAGEVMPTRTLNYWRRKYPAALFSNLYGPTEITVDCTYCIVDREFADQEKLPIGRPRRNTDILILNDKDQPVGEEERGELCVRGSSLALGYWNDPEKTAKAFVQNPLNQHYPERIYRTGDIVYKNSLGEIMFIGRKDSQIKHLGYRIELGEIEHLALKVEGICNSCATYNQTKKEIVLFYECDRELPPAFIRERLCASLPKYMVPTVFKRVPLMPLNGSGKIDRAALAEELQ